MKENDIKGPETPRPPHWMGDEPMQTVGDPAPRKDAPNHAGTHDIKSCRTMERPIPSDVYPVIDTDLGRDNVENDLPAADRQDL